MAPPSQANSRPRQANAQSCSNSDGYASHDGWVGSVRGPERPAAVRLDECQACWASS